MSELYIKNTFNKELETHKSKLIQENDKYKRELEISIEKVRKEHLQDLTNYDLFTNKIFIIYPELYGLIQKSLKDVPYINTITEIPDVAKIESINELETLLLQLEMPDKYINKLKDSYDSLDRNSFSFEFLELYTELKRKKTIERNELVISYLLDNKIYFSQKMIDLVSTYYSNLSFFLRKRNSNEMKELIKYQSMFTEANQKIENQIRDELQRKSD